MSKIMTVDVLSSIKGACLEGMVLFLVHVNVVGHASSEDYNLPLAPREKLLDVCEVLVLRFLKI